MNLLPSAIEGVVVVELASTMDDRGYFARAFDAQAFAAAGLMREIVHVNLSRNTSAGTLRGLHLQAAPVPDPKVVRCVRGAIFDVAVDVRPDSATRGQWVGRRLDASNGQALHIPGGCAHGFITLEPETDVMYLMGADYEPTLARGYRWNDPAFAIDWPARPSVISDRDASYEDFA